MRKLVVYLCFFIAFFIIYFLQSNFFSWFSIAGVMPNLFIVLTVVIGLFTGRNMGLTFGILFGFLLDLYLGRSIGITAVMLGLVGLFGGYFDKNFSKEGRMMIILVVVISTFAYELGKYGLECIVYKMAFETFTFFKILGIEVVFNLMLTIIFYPLIVKLGYKAEEVIKGRNILTRYF